MMREVNLSKLYRSAYRDLSQYSHGSFSVSASGLGDKDDEVMKFIALLAPIDTAIQFEAVRQGSLSPARTAQYKALFEQIADTLGQLLLN